MSTLKVYNNNLLLVSQEVAAGPKDTIDINVHGEVFVTDVYNKELKELREELKFWKMWAKTFASCADVSMPYSSKHLEAEAGSHGYSLND